MWVQKGGGRKGQHSNKVLSNQHDALVQLQFLFDHQTKHAHAEVIVLAQSLGETLANRVGDDGRLSWEWGTQGWCRHVGEVDIGHPRPSPGSGRSSQPSPSGTPIPLNGAT
jgi:uncharacterized membrane-anchored protein